LGVIRPHIKTAPLDLGLSASIDFDSASSFSLPGQTSAEPTIGLQLIRNTVGNEFCNSASRLQRNTLCDTNYAVC
jgi:hypothetical protein